MKSLYTDGFTLEVKVDINDNTFWLTQKEIARLFDVFIDNIGLHIKNILKDNELDKSTTEESSEVRIEGNRKVRRKVLIYNLDINERNFKLEDFNEVLDYFLNGKPKGKIVFIND